MKEIKIKKLSLYNFKGTRDLTIDFKGGSDMDIFGDNETGKSTIVDAFTWLLFGKDSSGSAVFNIKTIDKDGNVIPKIDHMVYAEILYNKETITLRREYREVWKKKDALEEALSSHETKYFVDGTPKKESEYKAYINQMMDETIFKLVTNPMYFTSLHWKEQRNILFSIITINESEIIESDPQFKILFDQIDGKSLEDFKIKKAFERKELENSLKLIAPKIDQTFKLMPEDVDLAEAKKQKEELQRRYDQINKELSDIANGANDENIQKIRQFESKLNTEKFNLEQEKRKHASTESVIDSLKRNLNSLREKYTETASQEYKPEKYLVCPLYGITCEDNNAKSKWQNSVVSAEQIFESKINEQLESINKQGVDAKDELAIQEEKLSSFLKNISEIEKEIRHLEDEIEVIKNILSLVSVDSRKETLMTEKAEVEWSIQGCINQLSSEITKKRLQKEIIELENEGRDLSFRISEIQQMEYIAKEFTKKYVSKAEEQINSMFEYVRFKMFSENMSGGLDEICTCTVSGVPFSDVNDAGKINAGLDIIKVISEKYDMKAPIFVDNKERVTKLIEVPTQIITLSVKEGAKLTLTTK